MERVENLPGVESAAAANGTLLLIGLPRGRGLPSEAQLAQSAKQEIPCPEDRMCRLGGGGRPELLPDPREIPISFPRRFRLCGKIRDGFRPSIALAPTVRVIRG